MHNRKWSIIYCPLWHPKVMPKPPTVQMLKPQWCLELLSDHYNQFTRQLVWFKNAIILKLCFSFCSPCVGLLFLYFSACLRPLWFHWPLSYPHTLCPLLPLPSISVLSFFPICISLSLPSLCESSIHLVSTHIHIWLNFDNIQIFFGGPILLTK